MDLELNVGTAVLGTLQMRFGTEPGFFIDGHREQLIESLVQLRSGSLWGKFEVRR
jgi:hypothetical protein